MTKLYEDGTDIFQVLAAIEKMTGLFILNRNLDYLYSFISGYRFFAVANNSEIKNLDKFDHFTEFIEKELNLELNELENRNSWFGYLRAKYGPDKGFVEFFELLNKFKTANKY